MKRLALAIVVGSMMSLTASAALAQQASETTLDRTILPIKEPKRRVYTELDVRNATPPPRFEVKAPAGRAQRPDRPDRRPGLWRDRAPSAARSARRHSSTGQERAALQQLSHHRAVLADAHGTQDRPQPPRRQHGLHHGDRHGVPGQHRQGSEQRRAAGRDAAAERLQHRRLRQVARTAAWEASVSGPFDRWPTHPGFDKFYGFMGGETNQWAPFIYDGMHQVELPDRSELSLHDRHDQPGHRVDQVSEVAHAGQAVLHVFRAGCHARAAPCAEGVDRPLQGQVRPGLGQDARGNARAADQARRRARRHQARAQTRGHQGLGHAFTRRKEALRPPDGGVRRVSAR